MEFYTIDLSILKSFDTETINGVLKFNFGIVVTRSERLLKLTDKLDMDHFESRIDFHDFSYFETYQKVFSGLIELETIKRESVRNIGSVDFNNNKNLPNKGYPNLFCKN